MFGWLRPKPPSDIAQAVIGLMDDPARWIVESDSVRHKDTDLVVRLSAEVAAMREGWPLVAEIDGEALPFRNADFEAVWKAYRKLRPAAIRHAEAATAERMREKLSLPSNPAALPAPAAESLEVVEQRVRRLRQAVLASNSASA